LRIIVLLGIVSLFADITYEGARSIIGPYLLFLGAGAREVGFISGLGELFGFSFRFLGGYLADRLRSYWGVTIIGYILNLFSVPLLGVTRSLGFASALVFTERLGKAIRAPARDTIISFAVKEKKIGTAFGIHEALDQIGAIGGPLLTALAIYVWNDMRNAFLLLFIPALFSIFFLFFAWRDFKDKKVIEVDKKVKIPIKLEKSFTLYLLGACFFAAGFCDFPIVAYHLKKVSVVSSPFIPIFYAFAMAVDGISAFFLGRFYDRFGIKIFSISIFISASSPFFLFLGDSVTTLLGILLWGIGMGAQESLIRAHVAKITPQCLRGTAYGIFNALFGFSWFLGSALIGFLYEFSILWLILFTSFFQLLSLPFPYLAQPTKKEEL
jgi:MFS family permease